MQQQAIHPFRNNACRPQHARVNLVLPGRAPGTDFGKNAQPRMQGSIPDAYLPGRAPGTDFGKNAQPRMQGSIPDAYADLAQRVFSEWSQSTLVTEAQDVAEAIWGAANDPGSPMRIAAGADAVALMGEAD
ncbi:hypothetical protein [Pseudomonas sp.]|uniref:hypothetical protein n=1 Tax=Pseudomonas sp. TaxID=306 RepID=UPI0025FC0CBB|nr:hypothetical protein [Pseudomonas sp.]